MIRVLHCISDTNIGGAGRMLLHLLRHFDRDSFTVAAVVPSGSALAPRIREAGAEAIEIDAGHDRSHERGGVAAYRRVIRDWQPDIVHTHASLDARIAARLCGVPSRIYTRHSVFDPPRRLTTFPGKQIAGGVNSLLATRILAVAEAAADNLRATGVPPEKITVILNGVEPLALPSPAERAERRAALGYREDDFVCGISARLEPYKGHSYLLETARKVLRQAPRTRFLLLGNGSCRAELEAAAADLGDAVRFTGFVSDVEAYYAAMDLSLNCSWGTEATSLALLEGMSLGLPAVVTDFGGNPGVIADGENGLLVPTRDAAAMAAAILRLENDPVLYARLSNGARRIFHEKFTAAAMTRQIENVYREEMRRVARS